MEVSRPITMNDIPGKPGKRFAIAKGGYLEYGRAIVT
jgi:hypothetical protein